MTAGGKLPTRADRLEERMKTQHAKGVTHIANQSRRHTSQIDDIHETLANMSDKIEQLKTEFAKSETRMIIVMIAVMALMTTILGNLISIPD